MDDLSSFSGEFAEALERAYPGPTCCNDKMVFVTDSSGCRIQVCVWCSTVFELDTPVTLDIYHEPPLAEIGCLGPPPENTIETRGTGGTGGSFVVHGGCAGTNSSGPR